MLSSEPVHAADRILKANRQLVGRLLGDVIRDSRGGDIFERIEGIRRHCVAFRKAGPGSPEADRIKHALRDLFAGSIDDRIDIIRAFSFFSHLSNIAEDRSTAELNVLQSSRRSIAAAVSTLQSQGAKPSDVEAWFERALLSPVLTAHPTEVKRKSIMDCEHEIFRLLEHGDVPPDVMAEREPLLYDLILRLWHTALLRANKLSVSDEIANGTTVFRRSFLSVVPRLHVELERKLLASGLVHPSWNLPPLLHIGSWIG
jgi:phosphoenolpyruvate carboxylase